MADWQIEFYEDKNGKRPVLTWLETLSDEKFAAVEKANQNILAVQGIHLASSSWLKALGDGLYEFRIRHSASDIEGMYKAKNRKPPRSKNSILIREFITFEKGKIIILLGAYDKGKDPSKKTQQEQIAKAQKRLNDWKRRKI
jgi:phage-related protein